MSADYSEDELLDGLDPAPARPTRPAKPAPQAAPPPGVWVIAIPHPRLPSVRTVLEALLVLVIVALLVERFAHWPDHPEPKPPPGPKPITAPLVASLVHDTDRDGYAAALIKADATLAPALKALDCDWRWLEASDPAAATLLKGASTPAVAIAEKGKTDSLAVIKAPQSGLEVLRVVKALRGKKD